MRKMFDEMPEELKAMFGITGEESTPTEFSGADFDYDNPPTSSEEIPDSVIPVEAMKKLVQARKLIIEAKETLKSDDRETVLARATKLSQSSPYAQVQLITFTETVEDALIQVNTALHIHDTGIKEAVDEGAKNNDMTPKEFANRFVHQHTMEKIIKELLG